ASASFIPFPIPSRLTDQEADRFLEFLAEKNYSNRTLAKEDMQQQLFLLLLYRLLPDSRGNIHLSLAQEYERLVTALERHLEESDGDAPQSTSAWQEQLAAARAALFPNLPAEAEQSEQSPFRHAPE